MQTLLKSSLKYNFYLKIDISLMGVCDINYYIPSCNYLCQTKQINCELCYKDLKRIIDQRAGTRSYIFEQVSLHILAINIRDIPIKFAS